MVRELLLPFSRADVQFLYNSISVPHPIELNRQDPNLAMVVNNLAIPGSAFSFDVPARIMITSPEEICVREAYADCRAGRSLDVNHDSYFVVLELDDGSTVRIEHVMPYVRKWQVVAPEQELGRHHQTNGTAHVHFYSSSSIHQTRPDLPIKFSNVPTDKRNILYDIDDIVLQSMFPGDDLHEALKQIDRWGSEGYHQFNLRRESVRRTVMQYMSLGTGITSKSLDFRLDPNHEPSGVLVTVSNAATH